MSFLTLIVSNVAIILSNRSWTRNIFQILVTRNKTVKWIAGGAVIFLILILNIPFLMDLFQFERLQFMNALICVVAGLFSITWFEVYKLSERPGRSDVSLPDHTCRYLNYRDLPGHYSGAVLQICEIIIYLSPHKYVTHLRKYLCEL